MKIEVITLHRVTNFGSLLQTYATQYAIEKLGHTCEVIDFQPEGLSFKRAIWPKGGSNIKKAIKLLPNIVCNGVQFRMTDKFLKQHIHITPKRYRNFNDLNADTFDGDIYLSGSDQIWNTQNSNPPMDLQAYYLGFAPEGARKIAFSGSFGRDSFSREELEDIGKWLSSYEAISVREDTALHILEQAGISDGQHVVDPTLLLTGDEWKRFCTKKSPQSGYVFVYNLNRNKTVEELAVAIAKQKGLRVINFADTFEFIPGAKNRLVNTPMDLISHIAGADYVVTDSFHGTAFSINLHKEVLSVPAPKFNSRLESILRLTGLIDSRYVTTVDSGLRAIESPIDWQCVDNALDAKRDESWMFLQEALDAKS